MGILPKPKMDQKKIAEKLIKKAGIKWNEKVAKRVTIEYEDETVMFVAPRVQYIIAPNCTGYKNQMWQVLPNVDPIVDPMSDK